MPRFRGLSRGGRLVLALAVSGAVFGIASAVQASIPDASGVIHGCYNPNGANATNGTTLNIIDSANASCGKNMQPIAWNQRGPTGRSGISGYEIVRASVMDPPNTVVNAQAVCPSGKQVLGGAGSVQGVPTGVWLHTQITDAPGIPSSYDVIAVNTTQGTQQINSTATCAYVS